MPARAAVVAAFAAVLSGCLALASPRDPSQVEAYARAFRALEPIMLEELASADARIGSRLHVRPRQLFDPFLFDVRAQGLDFVEGNLRRTSLPATTSTRRGVLAELALEQEVFQRLIDAERHRLAREREELPRAASALIRGFAETWPDWQTSEQVRSSDTLVAWRLRQVESALGPYALSRAELAELDGSIDLLSTRVGSLPQSALELARLRGHLAVMWVASFGLRGWDDVEIDVRAHLGGMARGYGALGALFARLAEPLRAQAEAGLSALGTRDVARALARTADLLASTTTCDWSSASRTVIRRLGPPPERRAVCGIVRALANTKDDYGELVAVIALHDAVALASRALAMLGPTRDPDLARERHPLMSALHGDREARVMRAASTEPVGAIALGLAAEILLHDGVSRVAQVARSWRAFGDGPLDIVTRELFADAAPSRGRGAEPLLPSVVESAAQDAR